MKKSNIAFHFIAVCLVSSSTAAAWGRHRITFEHLPGEIFIAGVPGSNDLVVLANSDTRMIVDAELNETNELGVFRNVRIEWRGRGSTGPASLLSTAWVQATRSGGQAILDIVDNGRRRIAVGNHPGQFNTTYQLESTSQGVTHDGARSVGGGSFWVEIDDGGTAALQPVGDHVSLNRDTIDGLGVVETRLVDAGDVSHSGTIVFVPPGDTDSDGDVDLQDFLTLSVNFGTSGDWEDGSFDYDGRVQFDDFLSLSVNFGRLPTAVVVPEPSSAVLLVIALSLLQRRLVAIASRSYRASRR